MTNTIKTLKLFCIVLVLIGLGGSVLGEVIGSYPTGAYPIGVAFDGEYIWVTNWISDTVSKIKASDGVKEGDYPAGDGPHGVAFDGTNIWIADYSGERISKIRVSDGVKIGDYLGFGTGSRPRGVAFDGEFIWVAESGGDRVIKMRTSDGVMRGVCNTGDYPNGIAFDGKYIWVANSISNTVSKIRASDGVKEDDYPTGDGPHGVAFDGEYIWVANLGDDTVSKIRASNGAKIGNYPVGDEPMGVAFDGEYIWVANSKSDTVTKILSSCTSTETICDDEIDNDCDGNADCLDSDCIFPENTLARCADGIDNDCDKKIDCADSQCKIETAEISCWDGYDNDCDGLKNMADNDCLIGINCVEGYHLPGADPIDCTISTSQNIDITQNIYTRTYNFHTLTIQPGKTLRFYNTQAPEQLCANSSIQAGTRTGAYDPAKNYGRGGVGGGGGCVFKKGISGSDGTSAFLGDDAVADSAGIGGAAGAYAGADIKIEADVLFQLDGTIEVSGENAMYGGDGDVTCVGAGADGPGGGGGGGGGGGAGKIEIETYELSGSGEIFAEGGLGGTAGAPGSDPKSAGCDITSGDCDCDDGLFAVPECGAGGGGGCGGQGGEIIIRYGIINDHFMQDDDPNILDASGGNNGGVGAIICNPGGAGSDGTDGSITYEDLGYCVPENTPARCEDYIDNDCDKLIDLDDPDCSEFSCSLSNFDYFNNYFFIINSSEDAITLIDQNGMMWVAGERKDWSTGYDSHDFLIKNSADNVVSWIDDATGNLYLSGTLNPTTGETPTSSGNFVIYDKTNNPKAWFTNTGDLYLKSCLARIIVEIPPAGKHNVGQYSSIGIDSYNRIYISYYDATSGDLKYAKSTDGGTNWLRNVIDDGASGGFYNAGRWTDIAMNPSNDDIYITYWMQSFSAAMLAKSTNTGNTWTIGGAGDGCNNDCRDFSISISNDDYINTVFTNGGTIWNAEGSGGISGGSISVAYPAEWGSVVATSADLAHIIYYKNSNLEHAREEFPWVISWIKTIIDDSADVGQYTSLIMDACGGMHGSYYDVTNGNLKYATSTDNGVTWTTTTVDSSANNVGMWTSITTDRGSCTKIHISYYDVTNKDLKYAKSTDGGSSWTTTTVDSSGDVGQYTAIATDTNNNIYISYYDKDNEVLKYAKSTDGGSSWTTNTADDGWS